MKIFSRSNTRISNTYTLKFRTIFFLQYYRKTRDKNRKYDRWTSHFKSTPNSTMTESLNCASDRFAHQSYVRPHRDDPDAKKNYLVVSTLALQHWNLYDSWKKRLVDSLPSKTQIVETNWRSWCSSILRQRRVSLIKKNHIITGIENHKYPKQKSFDGTRKHFHK